MSLRGLVVTAVAVTAVATLVGSSDASVSVGRSDPAAVELVRRAVVAETAGSYSGTEVLSDQQRTPSVERLDVTHLAAQGTVLVEPAAGGQPARSAFAPSGQQSPQLLVELLTSSYALVLGGRSSIAGRPARIVEALRADGSAAGRFWFDAATGLMLRRDVLDASGTPVRSVWFTQLQMAAAAPSHLPPIATAATGLGVNNSLLEQWRRRGWAAATSLAGMRLFDVREVAGTGDPVLHLSYSDGLSTASVFVQVGVLDTAAFDGIPGDARAVIGGQPVRVRTGQPNELTWTAGDHVITVVTDAPQQTVAALVDDLPHSSDPGVWDRLWRGLSRVGSWLNPFD